MSRLVVTLVVLSSLAVTAWCALPLFEPPQPVSIKVTGVAEVRHRDFDRIEKVLVERAPGWGLELRAHVAEAIAEESDAAGLDPLLVMALIQVESEFKADATSGVGARGLMQVRPTTLEWVAKREGVKLSARELAADPALNVRLGVRYLKYLKELFKGRMDLALMAYNAGPNKLIAGIKAKKVDWTGYVRAVRREYAVLKIAQGESADWALASREVIGDTAAR